MSIEKNNGGGLHAGPSSPSKASRAADDTIITQRLKRKASAAFSFPQPTPEKKFKSTSPLKLNRVPVLAAKPVTRAASTSRSPTKPSTTTGTIITATSRTPVKKHAEEPPRPARTSPRFSNPPDESPAKAALEKMSRLVLTERKTSTPQKQHPSPQKSPTKALTTTKRTAVGSPSTPSPTKKRPAQTPKSPSPEPADEEDLAKVAPAVHSRHRRPPFLDRQFYTYRDPRVVRESELCRTHFEELVKKFGFPELRSR